MTNLLALREFKGTENTPFVNSLSVNSIAQNLAGRSIWIIIGDRDTRVGTNEAIEFARRTTKYSLESTKMSDVTLIVQPEKKGHTTPAGAPKKAAKWIELKLNTAAETTGE